MFTLNLKKYFTLRRIIYAAKYAVLLDCAMKIGSYIFSGDIDLREVFFNKYGLIIFVIGFIGFMIYEPELLKLK